MENKNKKQVEVPIWEKLNLTVSEAAQYTGIGEHKLKEISDCDGCEFVLWIGNRRMFKRRKLEEFLEKQYSL